VPRRRQLPRDTLRAGRRWKDRRSRVLPTGPTGPAPGTYYDVRFEDNIFYCRSDKLHRSLGSDAEIDMPSCPRPA
jgi:hypothetical protein